MPSPVSGQNSTAIPPGRCLIHGLFAGLNCPKCSTAVPFQPTDPTVYTSPRVDFETRMEIAEMMSDDPIAQDVIDALRLALMAQKDPAEAIKIVNLLVELAPETESNRGIDLLLKLITEASLKVSLADA